MTAAIAELQARLEYSRFRLDLKTRWAEGESRRAVLAEQRLELAEAELTREQKAHEQTRRTTLELLDDAWKHLRVDEVSAELERRVPRTEGGASKE